MTTPEGRVKNRVNRMLEKYGTRIYRFMPVQMGMGKPGLDYFLCVNGHFIAVETKADNKQLTAVQQITRDVIQAAGGIVVEIHSIDDEAGFDQLQVFIHQALMAPVLHT
jgi:hypothetical protein